MRAGFEAEQQAPAIRLAIEARNAKHGKTNVGCSHVIKVPLSRPFSPRAGREPRRASAHLFTWGEGKWLFAD